MSDIDAQDEFFNGPIRLARSRGGRPIIQRPDGTLADYTRASSLGSVLDDPTGLHKWQIREAIKGICSRKQFVIAVNAHSLDNEKMDEIIEMGLDASGASDASHAGTAVHELADRYDHGQEPYVDEDYAEGINSYLWVTRGLEVVMSEEFGVCDELEVGGTPDRIYRLRGDVEMPDGSILKAGTLIIGDVKTSKTLKYGEIDFGVQLACYARSQRYDISGGKTANWKKRKVPVGERSPWVISDEGVVEEVNRDWALIVWIPQGTGTAELRPVDLQLGWELAKLAEHVRLTRADVKERVIHPAVRVYEDFERTLDLADSVADLAAAHQRAVTAEAWDADLKALFTARKLELIDAA